jgi:hypothetical protein
VRCVIHVHTTYSDGTAAVPELLELARRLGAEALLITDHDTLEAKRQGWEGWHDGVLCVVGLEISPKAGHLLAFGLDQEIPHKGRSEAEICAAVEAAGGISFAAHPFSEGSRMSRRIGRPHPWRGLADCAQTGIELWSLLTDEAERWSNPRQAISFLRDPTPLLSGPPAEHLALWDALGAERRVPALGGLDAHQPGLRLRGRVLTPMRHERFLGLLSTHVCVPPPTGNGVADTTALLNALGAGCAYLALDWVAPAAGFSFEARSGSGSVQMGAEAPAGEWELRARLPRPATIRLIRDGVRIAERRGDSLEHLATAPGVWRVEASIEVGGLRRTWIVSNPIYLREQAQ